MKLNNVKNMETIQSHKQLQLHYKFIAVWSEYEMGLNHK